MGLQYDQNKYMEQAKQQYDSSYNAKVTSLKNQLAQNQQALDQQKTGINNNYDLQVQQQNLNNKLNKNNVSNTILGRGLANSSIAVSGLAEQDAKNTRLVGNINRERTSALNDIESQKSLLAQNLNNTLAQMAADRETELMALARELYNEDWNRDYQDRQLAQQLAIAKLQASSYGSGGSGGYGGYGSGRSSSSSNGYDEMDIEGLTTLGNIIGSSDLNPVQKQDALKNYATIYAGVPQLKNSVNKANQMHNNISKANSVLSTLSKPVIKGGGTSSAKKVASSKKWA